MHNRSVESLNIHEIQAEVEALNNQLAQIKVQQQAIKSRTTSLLLQSACLYGNQLGAYPGYFPTTPIAKEDYRSLTLDTLKEQSSILDKQIQTDNLFIQITSRLRELQQELTHRGLYLPSSSSSSYDDDSGSRYSSGKKGW